MKPQKKNTYKMRSSLNTFFNSFKFTSKAIIALITKKVKRHFDTTTKFELVKYPVFEYSWEKLSKLSPFDLVLAAKCTKRLFGDKRSTLYFAAFYSKFIRDPSDYEVTESLLFQTFHHRISKEGMNEFLLPEREFYACIRIQVTKNVGEEVIKFDTFQEFFDFMYFWGDLTLNVIDMANKNSQNEKPIDPKTLMKEDEMYITLNPKKNPFYWLDEYDYLSNKDIYSTKYERYNSIRFGATFEALDEYISSWKFKEKYGHMKEFTNVNSYITNLDKLHDFTGFLEATGFTFIFDNDEEERVLNFLIILKRMEKLLQVCLVTGEDYCRFNSIPKETQEKEFLSKQKMLLYVQEIIDRTLILKKRTHKNTSFKLKVSEQYRIYKSLHFYIKNYLYPQYIRGSLWLKERKIFICLFMIVIGFITIIRILTHPYYFLLLPLVVMYFFSRPQPRSFPTTKAWFLDFRENFWHRYNQKIKRVLTNVIVRRTLLVIIIFLVEVISDLTNL